MATPTPTNMARYIVRRLLWFGPALLVFSLVTFVLMHLTPGGPFEMDPRLPPETRERLASQYGLDRSLPEQYWLFVTNAVQGDLGLSVKLQRNEPVSAMLANRLPATLVLGGLSLVVASIAGLALGIVSALHRNRLADYVSVLISTGGAAVPAFVTGVILVYVFALQLHVLPTQGWFESEGPIPGWLPPLEQMVLPVATLSLLPLAYLARITRTSLLEVMHEDYVRTATAKGLPRRQVIWRHAMRNAWIPVFSVMGPLAGALLTGSFIVENLFAVPGVGTLFVRSVEARDYNVIMGMTLFYATVALGLYLLIDIAYAYLDPRIRYR